jgi:adenosylmethionine-8-amino-7-oxononanoate aminotransferase
MGRTGRLFAHQFFETKPDIVSTAKAIAGGFPLGACLATKNSASVLLIFLQKIFIQSMKFFQFWQNYLKKIVYRASQ